MKKFVSLLLTAVLLCTVLTVFAVPAFADIAPGMIIRVYEGNEIIYADYDKSWDSIFSEMKTKCYSDWKGKTSLRCEIELNREFTVDSLYYCSNLPMPITLNLHGKTLVLNYGDYWELDYSLTINGDGGTIKNTRSGDEYNCSILVNSGKLDVSDATIDGFKTNMKYPIFAMGNDCQDASFSNCTFKNCSSTNYGGAICMEETNNLDIICCTFDSCSSYYGGAVYLEDIINNSTFDTLYVKDSTFTGCSAYYGGAIYIEDNCAGYDDGGDRYTQNFCFYKSSITGCKATYDGGGIYIDCEEGHLKGNISLILEISSCQAGRYGGGIFSDGYQNDTTSVNISGCKAQYGGGIYMADDGQDLNKMTIQNCAAKKEGGAYYAEYKISFNGCTFKHNSPSDGNATGSVLSEGSLTIVVGIAAAVVFGLGGFILGTKKKKKPALAGDENKDEE